MAQWRVTCSELAFTIIIEEPWVSTVYYLTLLTMIYEVRKCHVGRGPGRIFSAPLQKELNPGVYEMYPLAHRLVRLANWVIGNSFLFLTNVAMVVKKGCWGWNRLMDRLSFSTYQYNIIVWRLRLRAPRRFVNLTDIMHIPFKPISRPMVWRCTKYVESIIAGAFQFSKPVYIYRHSIISYYDTFSVE